jgi:LemA protein
MLNITTIIILIIAIVIIVGIISYNSLIRKKNYVKEAWSSIDVQLKKKANILTNVVDTLKMQTNYERETLEKIMSMRNSMLSQNKDEAIRANDSVSKMMASMFAVAENYPQLQSNSGFLKLMENIKDVEEKIAYARTRYNTAVMDYNSSLQTFPSNIFAGALHFLPEKSYEISDVEREYSDNMRIGDL